MKSITLNELKVAANNPSVSVGWADFNKVQADRAKKRIRVASWRRTPDNSHVGTISFITVSQILSMTFEGHIPNKNAIKYEVIADFIENNLGIFYHGSDKRAAFRLAERHYKSYVVTESPLL